jgi:hypothetical protein
MVLTAGDDGLGTPLNAQPNMTVPAVYNRARWRLHARWRVARDFQQIMVLGSGGAALAHCKQPTAQTTGPDQPRLYSFSRCRRSTVKRTSCVQRGHPRMQDTPLRPELLAAIPEFRRLKLLLPFLVVVLERQSRGRPRLRRSSRLLGGPKKSIYIGQH